MDSAAYASPPEKVAKMQQQAMQATADYLKQEMVPQPLIEKMLQRASTQVYWLTEDDDISGRAPWFEEMMIARCRYDPVYARESEQWVVNALTSGRSNADLGKDPQYKKYIAWKQAYNACEYAIREQAQQSMRH